MAPRDHLAQFRDLAVFGKGAACFRDQEARLALGRNPVDAAEARCLHPLTGGYRKTPVMQIGADIFCDSQIIIRELERRFPEPSVFPKNSGFPYGLRLLDRPAFLHGERADHLRRNRRVCAGGFQERSRSDVGGDVLDRRDESRGAVREDQWRAHASFVAEQLGDGRQFVLGDNAERRRYARHMNFWFMKGAVAAHDGSAAQGISRHRRLVRACDRDRPRQAHADGRRGGARDRQGRNIGGEVRSRSF